MKELGFYLKHVWQTIPSNFPFPWVFFKSFSSHSWHEPWASSKPSDSIVPVYARFSLGHFKMVLVFLSSLVWWSWWNFGKPWPLLSSSQLYYLHGEKFISHSMVDQSAYCHKSHDKGMINMGLHHQVQYIISQHYSWRYLLLLYLCHDSSFTVYNLECWFTGQALYSVMIWLSFIRPHCNFTWWTSSQNSAMSSDLKTWLLTAHLWTTAFIPLPSSKNA